ncbi:hypothetical protein GCM10010277_73670 [Streptomyces longisporoflavus]|uniref:hypothetical protein n=1 Tax=Streptomyces longisporoflavus TaxID=28044 RepID=UPI00167E29B1|nr:hypothetical protein [Streptomyces longisporoflavus]GGV66079.1 hypothetical protein GCM10010277_73670 [Streptomyces longisporoflavus]
MGFDTSFHPLDLPLIERRLLPFLAGRGQDDDIDDLVARAVEIRKVRFRAKAWALGVQDYAHDHDQVPFEAHLYVWGRPFFITGDGPEQITRDLQRYLAAPADGVDAIAAEMANRLDPALARRIEPDTTGQLPGDDALADSLTTPLRMLRGAAIALRNGERHVRRQDGREFDAALLLTREVPYCAVEFAAALLPGWMSRGYTWPTRLCTEAGLDTTGFTAPTALTGLLRQEFPHLQWPTPPATIVSNYAIGGLTPAPSVPAARAYLAAHRHELKCDAIDAQKINEAMGVAEHLGLAFCEATELYSAMEGNLN